MSLDSLISYYGIDSSTTSTATATSTESAAELGKTEFLNLLVTQLQNQDPLDPVKNEDFIAQLAQFNSLEQMINLNANFEAMLELQQMSNASTFIGKSISWYNEDSELTSGIVSEVYITSDGPALNTEEGLVLASDVVSYGEAS
jgi:flagellar basal-body rod modification protein FlgD